jgi:hypothetical protein
MSPTRSRRSSPAERCAVPGRVLRRVPSLRSVSRRWLRWRSRCRPPNRRPLLSPNRCPSRDSTRWKTKLIRGSGRLTWGWQERAFIISAVVRGANLIEFFSPGDVELGPVRPPLARQPAPPLKIQN